MNAGFSNLDTLKQHLLAPALRAGVTYDVQLADLGLGMAGLIEQFCNRKFLRVENDTAVFTADRCEFLLPRTPLESVSLAELKIAETDGWVTQTDPNFIRSLNLTNGIVDCGPRDVGPYYGQVRFTFTGGYWWGMSEPNDVDYPNNLPTGANILPGELKLAWLLQCKHVWQTIDPRGVKIVATAEGRVTPQVSFSDLDLVPQVKETLAQFIRYSLV
ncbi:MAG TPA: hypothetical protein DCQ92_17280 [Verrucomicrobia subdivision 3 bacterium]|nr:hypothetical protein [Limisphaerales bacterium]